jgi:hypothetical protein
MILLSMDAIARRRDIAANELAGLRTSLTRDLQPLLDTPLFIPAEKARLTRAGGRCPLDGEMLEFDPFSPRAHRCPRCDAVHDSDEHYRWWVMGYQLWLAERAVHAAVLNLLVPDEKLAGLAAGILEGVTERYSGYPNVDNVLGPSRPFFSTYLESIWLLQLCVAASALDQDASASTIVSEFRDEVAVPAAALIRSFDEGASNRQVWNAAALAAAGGLLGDQSLLAQGITGDAGLLAHLEHGLLPDGAPRSMVRHLSRHSCRNRRRRTPSGAFRRGQRHPVRHRASGHDLSGSTRLTVPRVPAAMEVRRTGRARAGPQPR